MEKSKMTLKKLLEDFKKQSNPSKAKLLSGFFKTGNGQYGEGDVFLGLTVPQQRILAKKYVNLSFDEIQALLNSKIHEHRLTGLIILTYQYETASKEKIKDITKMNEKEKKKKAIFDFYLKNSKNINNWDLVDVTCPRIVGDYLLDKDRKILYQLAVSNNLWEKRIAIISTAMFIRNNQFADTLKLSNILIRDKHDLIHKAVGWMLREVGKKNQQVEKEFLNIHAKLMPRTMLRYAIEKFNDKDKKYYMNKKNE
jgi:3-methyladenine DNA glycosylase AlkD